jgi:hypothetical protein
MPEQPQVLFLLLLQLVKAAPSKKATNVTAKILIILLFIFKF